MMKSIAVLAGASMALTCAASASAQVNISYYSQFSDNNPGISVSGTPFATGVAPSIQLGDFADTATNTAANWPGAAANFAAIINETVSASTSGTYSFDLTSDDGSYLYVNGALAISDGGYHSEVEQTGMVYLNQGLNNLQVQYDNVACCGAGVELSTPDGVTITSAAPEPATWALMLAGIGGIGLMLRRARKTMGFRFKDALAA